ncbi:GRB2-associated-binding protein 1-like isoform X1 [Lytechinus variegatus]|uniref:GRB2-associated-binding protein 1-like isoform X1 n=1 Tax=Lytechinus variegatus TaxID=7654 RepID=UPI001BB1E30B|nr:GRB2-associated-binding protein 1-like isoform X1 [Lytechinus variegatus]
MTSQVVLYEGYLTKSPPEHKINRARWCKRFFQLCDTEGEIFLQYFKDNTCTKLKGTINLRECEQVDQGLSFETKSKLKDAHIFDIVTQRRKYFLVTETEEEMLRWVHSICTACGFQSEDSISTVSDQTDGPGSPARFAETPLNVGSPPMTTTRPPTTNGNESYIDIAECETGINPLASSNGLPPKLNAKESLPQHVPQARQPKTYNDTMSSTSSSAPSDSAPSPPNSRPTSQVEGAVTDDIYDVPPVRQSDDAPPVPLRPAATLEESIYKVVPPSKDPTSYRCESQLSSASSNRGSFSNSDDLGSGQTYDLVPSFNDRRSSGFESVESNGPQSNYETPPPRPPPPVTEDIYQVPPSRPSLDAETDCLYDVPPMSPQIDNTYDMLPSPMQKTPLQNIPSHLKSPSQISTSTDNLARSFEEISQQNANQSLLNGDLEHSTYDPVPAMDLNASIGSNCSYGSVFKDLGPSTSAMEAPPRPAKPQSMCPSTPPPSIDEKYVAPAQPNHRFSPSEMRRRLTSIETKSPPSMANHHQHKWMDQVVPPPGYINTKRSGTANPGMARPNSSFNPRGYIPMRSNTVSCGSRSTFPANGFQNGQQPPPGSYMAMQGSSESPKSGLGAPISEESYMHMQSQNEGNPDMYTLMINNSAPAIPRRPPRPSTSSIISVSSTASGDSLPPPIDRRNKPRSTDSSILNPEMLGMEGSFYATGTELPADFPVQNPRTKSFSKRPSRHRESGGFPSTPPRPHRSVHSSSSSHTDSIAPPMDESYVFSEPTPITKPRIESHQFQTRHASIDSAIHPHPSPTLPPQSHTVEYLELDHDSDSPSTLPRPPKPTSPKDQVEYIHLDMEKTKALQEVTQNREESYRPKNNDGGTLKR